jgi:hypothetical protein
MEATASAQPANLFLLEDLEDVARTGSLAESDLGALHAVGDWFETFVASSNGDLGRTGTVRPFIPGALERRTLWLAPEQIADGALRDVVALVDGYKRLLLSTEPVEGDDANYKSIVVVFTDLATDRAQDFLDGVLEQLAIPSYVGEGLVLGEFYESNEGTAIYNPRFRPFTSPVPFLLMSLAVITDWKFFLDDEDWLNRWVARYGESGSASSCEGTAPVAVAGGPRLSWKIPRSLFAVHPDVGGHDDCGTAIVLGSAIELLGRLFGMRVAVALPGTILDSPRVR